MSSVPTPQRPRPARAAGSLLSIVLYATLLLAALFLAAGQPGVTPSPAATPLPPVWQRSPERTPARVAGIAAAHRARSVERVGFGCAPAAPFPTDPL